MKKIIAIALLLCITVPILGTYSWLSYEQYQTKKTVKRKLKSSVDKSQLIALKFTPTQAKAELHWEHSKEFAYKGEMYDVVTKETNGDTTTYWCWWDKEETLLNKQLAQLVSDALGNNPDRNKQQKQILDFCTTLFYQHTEPYTLHGFITVSATAYNTYTIQYNFAKASPPTPPPQAA